MPFKSEHSARLKSPGQYTRFARQNDKLGTGVDAVYGIKGGKSEIQAIRFDKSKFSTERAKDWLKKHDKDYIKFEPAKKESKAVEFVKSCTESFNDLVDFLHRLKSDVDSEIKQSAPRKDFTFNLNRVCDHWMLFNWIQGNISTLKGLSSGLHIYHQIGPNKGDFLFNPRIDAGPRSILLKGGQSGKNQKDIIINFDKNGRFIQVVKNDDNTTIDPQHARINSITVSNVVKELYDILNDYFK